MGYQLLEEKNYNSIREKLKKIVVTPLVITENDELLRKLAEKEKNIILAPSLKKRKDKLYERGSGFDRVIVEFCRKNNHALGIIVDEFLEANALEKGKLLARIKQNIKIAKKTKIKVRFITLNEKNKKDPKNLFSLGLMLGMDTKTAKEAIS